MTMGDPNDGVNGVDEAFESFAKEKLKELGMKQGQLKSSDTMENLEMRMKLRLEKNLANQSSVAVDIKQDAMNKSQKLKRGYPVVNYHNPSSSVTDECQGKNHTETQTIEKKFKLEIASTNSKNSCSEVSGNTVTKSELDKSNSSDLICKSAESLNPSDKEEKLTVSAAESASKKDISIIRKKIQLLKARSAEADLKREIDGKLDNTNDKENADKSAGDCKNESGGESSKAKKADHENGRRTRERKRSRERKSSSKRSRHRSRSRSSSPSRKHQRRRRSRSKKRRRSSSRERRHKKSRRKSKSPRRISTKDKIRLLEIAKANAMAQHRANITANSVTSLGQIVREGSMSVSELTTICKDIVSDKLPEKANTEPLTKETAEKMLETRSKSTVHHPFLVKEAPISIKPVKTIPPPPPALHKPIETLSKEFPVSCGQQHRKKEVMEAVYGKWEAVAKDKTAKKVIKDIVTSDSVFVQPAKPNLDLSTAIAERISAARELQMNPNDHKAKNRIETAQKALDSWTQSKQVIGQFTGDSQLTAMPRNLLESGTPAWFKADSLKNAKPVVGIGKSLLQKMGWIPGTGLGKSMPGQLEPLSVDFKTDRRGLSSYMEAPALSSKKSKKISYMPISKDLSNKHPVSALNEICSKRHWAPPEFRLVDPLNLCMFTFHVIVGNNEYVGKPASNKKEAKKKAAAVALQNMGLVPKSQPS